MRRITLYSLRVALLLLILLPLLGGSIGEAKKTKNPNKLLRGDYAFNYFRSCVQTLQGGFNADLTLSEIAFVRTTAIVGILSYNGDGTASSVHRFRNMSFQALNPGSRPVGQGGVTNCTLDYTVDPVDRSFTHQNVLCSGTIDINEDGIVDAGDRPFTITGLMPEGQISKKKDRKTLLLHDPGVAVETITFDPGTIDEIIRDRICIHTGTAVKQSK